MSRPYKFEDEERVRSLHEQSFPFPDFRDPHYVVKEVIENNGVVIGMGAIRLTAEALIILDGSKPKLMRAAMIEDLLKTGIYKGEQLGVDELHVFLKGENAITFSQVLKKKFGFVECTGLPLVLNIGG